MTTEPSAVQQAIDLLTGGLADARQRRDELNAEIVSIENALASLGVNSNGGGVSPQPSEHDSTDQISTPSVRAAVKSILDSAERAFAPAEIRNLIPAAVMNGKSAQQRTNSVRTALWSLRQRGEAFLVDDGRTMSTKWRTSATTALPAENGTGSPNPEEAVL